MCVVVYIRLVSICLWERRLEPPHMLYVIDDSLLQLMALACFHVSCCDSLPRLLRFVLLFFQVFEKHDGDRDSLLDLHELRLALSELRLPVDESMLASELSHDPAGSEVLLQSILC